MPRRSVTPLVSYPSRSVLSHAAAEQTDLGSETGPYGTPVLRALLPVALGVLYIAAPNSEITVLTLSLAAALATAAGQADLLVYCYGLSVTLAAARLQGIPESAIILTAIAVGALSRALIRKKFPSPDWLLLAIAYFVGAYALLDPASTKAGNVEAYAIVILPIALLVLRWALTSMPAQATTVMWFTAGCSISIGMGLLQAYKLVGSNYAFYANDRVFLSAIGSSNYAAALSCIPGLLILGLGLRALARLKQAILILIALPFLAAPLILISRGAVVALACGMLAVIFSTDWRWTSAPVERFLTLAAILMITALTAATEHWYIWERFTAGGDSGQYLSGRLALWHATIGYIQWNPLTGLGPGHVTNQLMSSYGIAYPHEFYLGVLAQLGICGGVLFLWAIRPTPMTLWSPLVPGIVAIMVNSAVEPVMDVPTGAILFAGLAAVHWSHARQSGGSTLRGGG